MKWPDTGRFPCVDLPLIFESWTIPGFVLRREVLFLTPPFALGIDFSCGGPELTLDGDCLVYALQKLLFDCSTCEMYPIFG